eukprot:scaffold297105_cov21-Tisochrysis_lutea.AAC.1
MLMSHSSTCVPVCIWDPLQLAKSVSEAMAGSVAKIQDVVKKALALAKRASVAARYLELASSK